MSQKGRIDYRSLDDFHRQEPVGFQLRGCVRRYLTRRREMKQRQAESFDYTEHNHALRESRRDLDKTKDRLLKKDPIYELLWKNEKKQVKTIMSAHRKLHGFSRLDALKNGRDKNGNQE